MKASELKTADKARMVLIYGMPFTGKTEFAAGIATIKKVIWLDFDQKFDSVIHSPRIDKASLANIELIRVRDTLQTPLAFLTLKSLLRKVPTKICDAHGAVGCKNCIAAGGTFTEIDLSKCGTETALVLDSVTALASSAKNYINRDELISQGDLEVVTDIRDYGRQMLELNNIFLVLQSSRFSTIAISHEQSKTLDADSNKQQVGKLVLETGRKTIIPTVGSVNYSQSVSKYFDDVIYAEIMNKKYVYSTDPLRSDAIAGSRTGRTKLEHIRELFE